MFQGIFHVTRKTIERGQSVEDGIRCRSLLEKSLDVLPGSDVVAHIHERDCVVVVLFHGFELLCRGALEVLVANAEMNGSSVSKLAARTGEDLFKQRFRLLEL